MSGDGSDSTHLISGTNPPARPTASTPAARCAVLGTTKADKAFASGFKALAHFAPGIYSAEAFDAANTIIFADEGRSSPQPGGGVHHSAERRQRPSQDHLPRASRRRSSFEPNGNIAGTAIYVNQVQNGKLVQLGLE